MARGPRDRSDVQVFFEIAAIDRLASSRLERVLPDGMSHAQFAVLSHLARSGAAESPLSLARAFDVTKGAMTNTLQRLEQQSLVIIAIDPDDARRKIVSVTAKGLKEHDAALAGLRPMTDTLRSAFTPDEFDAALPFLTALRVWLREAF